MIKCVVFDFDGTLVDSNDLKRQACFEVVEDHPGGSEVMEAVLEEISGDRSRIFAMYAQRIASRGLDLDPAELTERYTMRVDTQVIETPEMPGATLLLSHLRGSGVLTYLSSATPEPNLLAILEQRGWVDRFDGIHGHPKEKGETLRRILGKEGLTREEIAVVGDGTDDEESAAVVDCAFIPVGAGSYFLKTGKPTYALDEVPARIGIENGS